MTEPLPGWIEDRDDQRQAAKEIAEGFGWSDVVVFIGPTGSGKSVVAELARREMGAERAAYVVSTNTLLRQITRSFPYYAEVMGRRNYPTELFGTRFESDGLSCADCTADGDEDECDWCAEACPYEMAKARALSSDTVATNYAYYLTECNGPARMTERGKRPFDLVICDEGDRAANEVARHTEISISRRVKERLGLAEPKYKTVESSWPEWFDYAVRHIGARMPRRSGDLREERYRRTLVNLKKDLGAARDEVANGEWLYCVDEETEALTDRGWLKWKEIEPQDRFLCLDPITNQIDWVMGTLNVFSYEGQLIRWAGRKMDALTTAGHEWLTWDGRKLKSRDLAVHRPIRIGGGKPNCFAPESRFSDQFIEFVGWYVTEGADHVRGGIQLIQSQKVNPGYCERIDALIAWIREQGFYARAFSDEKRGFRRWYVGTDFARIVRRTIPDKQLPPSFLLSLTEAQAELLRETLIDGDGYRGKTSEIFGQKNLGRIDSFQMLGAMLGKATRARDKHWDVMTYVSTYGIPRAWPTKRALRPEPYSGIVWCPSVPTGVWFARRNGSTYWTGNSDYSHGGITFKPIHVRRHAPKLLLSHGVKFLFMSATLIPDMVTRELGIEGSHETVEMASTFPPENRPIYYKSVAAVTKKNAEESWPLLAAAITEIVEAYPGERVMVHTVSYGLTTYLQGALGTRRPIVTYSDAAGREKALARFRATAGAVFLAPGMERGISLDYDDCRVVVVPKVPWANKGDRAVQKRLYAAGGEFWYRCDAVNKIVQACGRAVRAVDDAADMWILDSGFLKLYRQEKKLFPAWFREAVQTDGSAVLRERRASLVVTGH